MFKVNNKDTRMTPIGVVLVSLLLTLNIFHTCSSVSIGNSKQANAGWVWIRAGGGLLILMLEKLNWFRLTVLITLVLLMWKWMGLFLRKNQYFEMTFSPKFETGSPSCYLELLDKLQKQKCRAVGLFFATSLEPMAHRQNIFNFSISITFVDVHLNWLNWLPYLILVGVLLVILIDCMIFMSPWLDVTRTQTYRFYKDIVNSFFPGTARL